MNEYKFKNENMKNIKSSFQEKIKSDAEYTPAASRSRIIRKSYIAALAAVVVVLSTAICAFAAGFDLINAWQRLFEKEAAIDVGERVISSGISMDVQNLYTDGEHAVLKMTLRDLEGARLSENIKIASIDESIYSAYLESSFFDPATGEVTCIVNINFWREAAQGDTLAFAINSIIINPDYSDDFHPFECDLYEAAAGSQLLPSVPDDEWLASARAGYVPAIGDPENTVRRGGVKMNLKTGEDTSLDWLPLDPSAGGTELVHWLSLIGVGYEDGFLHVQLRYNDLFGYKY